ncbi:MAG: class I SAM-dependent methyltransferase [Bacteroidetes bacterium]|nr:class I SAM-dependent methyltransferase [Bacteroidota bacterium]
MSFLKYKIETHLDDPQTTLLHREIILSKPFLKQIYIDWYLIFKRHLAEVPEGKLLEIGSGGGFIKEVIPSVITSDIMPLNHCDMTFSAEEIPFKDCELSAIFMINVFHHIPKPYLFLAEAQRTLKKGGKIIMIEPANSIISRFIYKNYHHEPFDEKGSWEIQSSGPLSGSNQALPYIYFERDIKKFQDTYPKLRLKTIEYHTPIRYVLSGGVSRKSLVPDWSYSAFKGIEWLLSPILRQIGLFETIVLEKTVN